jgi:pyruvate dehydrogenase E2 component (dihydrolipoamide acetyltransferase)
MAELPLTMPKMSMTMEEGTIVAWLKNVGDTVRAGEPIAEVATDKVDMEVESPFEGVLARIIAEPDEVIKVGEPIAWITTDADDLLGGLFDDPVAPASTDPSIVSVPDVFEGAPDAAVAATGWPAAVPLARTIAHEQNIDLSLVVPTGPWGTIRVSDVEGRAGMPAPSAAQPVPIAAPVPVAEPAPVAAPVPAESAPTDPWESRRRRTRTQVAKVMSASTAVPQFTVFIDLDLSVLAQERKTTLGGASWTAILVRAQALALAEHPQLNGFWVDGRARENENIGIALAVDSPAGLLAPVLQNPQRGTLAELTTELAELVDDAKAGNVAASRLSGGTSVFSNLGGLGVESFNALLTPPQSTALSAGAVRNTVVVVGDGAFGVRLTCTVGLTVDHRVADGADAARMLATIKKILSDPQAVL